MIPGFDPSVYSDDQILNKIADLNARLSFAEAFMSNNGSDMMIAMVEALQNEYQERRFLESWKKSKSNRVIETEPDLKSDKAEERKDRPKKIKINIPIRTDKPVVPDKD